MELTKFSVTNFRSITSARHVTLSGTTVLVGKNNEGKSNLLKALSIAMNEISDYASGNKRSVRRPIRRLKFDNSEHEDTYYWDRDFPILFQNGKGSQDSIFELEFDLDDTERDQLRNETSKFLNHKLSVKISIGPSNRAKIIGTKKGRGSKSINHKPHIITNFITDRLSFNYIPAVRTHNSAKKVIDDMISQELKQAESEPEYENALKAISKTQEPILKDIKNRIEQQLSEFFPKGTIKSVEIPYDSQSRRVHYRGDFNVIIDDGNPTDIEEKGDGVKSLVALALLKNRSFKGSASIIAIEEPESHLHPEAIHQLKGIIESLEEENQIVLTTHNPLFVNRDSIESNIIVNSGYANPAKNIQEIRDILGVKVSDNLHNTEFVIIVEGKHDETILSKIFSIKPELSEALKANVLTFYPIGSVDKLEWVASFLQGNFCKCSVIFDGDKAGKAPIKRCIENDVLDDAPCYQISNLNSGNAEIEDWICIDKLISEISREYGLTEASYQPNVHEKFSKNIEEWFKINSKPINDSVKSNVKTLVAGIVSSTTDIDSILSESYRVTIETYLDNIANWIKRNNS